MGALIANFVYLLAVALQILLIVRVIMTWVVPRGGGGFVAFVYQVTEPILAPIRRILPPTAGIDFSPLVALLLIGAVAEVLRRVQ